MYAQAWAVQYLTAGPPFLPCTHRQIHVVVSAKSALASATEIEALEGLLSDGRAPRAQMGRQARYRAIVQGRVSCSC
jgi:hypothetical protein